MVTVGLTVFKLAVGYLSGSVSVISEGVHSALDVVSALVAYFTVREAAKPADKQHPYGHGKIETLSSLFEAVLLVAAALFIVVESIDHFKNPQPIQYAWVTWITLAISVIVSFFTYKHNLRAAEISDSRAIHVNALHFLSDVVSSLGVLIGLIAMELTGWWILDPIVAVCVAAYIFKISITQVRSALNELSDVSLPPFEQMQIEKVIQSVTEKHEEVLQGAHDLRTRKSGDTRHIDFHLSLCGEMSVKKSHDLCDHLEEKIIEVFPKTFVNIHVEPCEHHQPECQKNCKFLKKHS